MWLALTGGSVRHLFTNLGTIALCGVTRSYDHRTQTVNSHAGQGLPNCAKCVGVIEGRRAYWAAPEGSRPKWPG